MPIFEYECKHCGRVFESLHLGKITKKSSVCPNCGQLAKRIISVSNFVLKGTGFYKNDYGSGPGSGKKEDEHSNVAQR